MERRLKVTLWACCAVVAMVLSGAGFAAATPVSLAAHAAPEPSSSPSPTLEPSSSHVFTVSGSAMSTQGQAGKQATGSPKDAMACETWEGQETYKKAEAIGHAVAATWQTAGLATASALLTDFLGGTGAEVDYPDASQVATEIMGSSAFTAENNAVLTYIGEQLTDGATQIQLPTGPDYVHALAFLNYITEPDLYWALRYTHQIDVSGSGSLVGTNYVGSLTYVISESYGFNEGNTFLGIGTAMRYLQTTCGAPYYPGGAHWFPVSVTVTVQFTIPS